MKWKIITIVVALAIAATSFWYFSKSNAVALSPESLLPNTTSLILWLPADQDLNMLLDSNAVPVLSKWFQVWQIDWPLSRSSNLLLFMFEVDGVSHTGIISDSDIEWINKDIYSFVATQGNLHLYATFSFDLPTAYNEISLPRRERIIGEGLRVHIKSNLLLDRYFESFSTDIKQLILDEVGINDWIELELTDDGAIAQLIGIAKSSIETIALFPHEHLLRFAPDNSALFLATSNEDAAMALVQCNYHTLTASYENVFVFFESASDTGNTLESAQSYQGIPISISNLPSAASAYNLPWAHEAYMARIGTVSVFGSSFKALELLLNDFLNDNLFISSPHYPDIDKTLSTASLTLIIQPHHLVSSELTNASKEQFEGINALAFQSFATINEFKFVHMSLLHHQEPTLSIKPLWTVLLDSTIAQGPWHFKNHNNQASELLVQDSKNQLYLIDAEGKILWKKKLENPIVGEVKTVDAFTSQKFQMLFSTKSHIYLIDRNGNSVGTFPYKLTEETLTAPNLIQYSKKDEPRIFFENGKKLALVDATGEPVKGWKSPTIGSNKLLALKHTSIKGKDYIIAVTATQVFAFDRQGTPRQDQIDCDSLVSIIEFYARNTWGESELTGFTKDGALLKLRMDGRKETKTLIDQSIRGFQPLPKEKVMLFFDEYTATIDHSGDTISEFKTPETIEPKAQIVQATPLWIGLQSSTSSSYFLIDENGGYVNQKPLAGSGNSVLLSGQKDQVLVLGDGYRELKAISLK